MATAFSPSFQASRKAFSTSSTVVVAGMLIVFEIAPDRKGCTAPIMRRCPEGEIVREPLAALKAQSKTGRSSSRRAGAPSIVSSWSM